MENLSQGLYSVLPIRNALVFPHSALPLRVGRAASVAAIEHAHTHGGDWLLVVSQSKDTEGADPRPEDLYSVGTLCKIERLRGSAEDSFQVLVRGVARFRVLNYETKQENGRSWLLADAEPWKDVLDADTETTEALKESLKAVAKEILELLPADMSQLSEVVDSIDDLAYLTNLCAVNLDISVAQKQGLLEAVSIKARALSLLETLQSQKESLQIKSEIRDKLSHKVGKMQREALLREQMKTIREELGEEEDQKSRDNYRDKIDEAGMPAETKKLALEELKRLETIGNTSPESTSFEITSICFVPCPGRSPPLIRGNPAPLTWIRPARSWSEITMAWTRSRSGSFSTWLS